jgi:hypothetical protein
MGADRWWLDLAHFANRRRHTRIDSRRTESKMSPATGLIIAFALIAIGGVGLAVFAITHRQREDDVKKDIADRFGHA